MPPCESLPPGRYRPRNARSTPLYGFGTVLPKRLRWFIHPFENSRLEFQPGEPLSDADVTGIDVLEGKPLRWAWKDWLGGPAYDPRTCL